MSSDKHQKALWKIVQKSNLQELDNFLQSLNYDPKILLLKIHEASGDTLMHLACRHGNIQIVKYLHAKWDLELESRNLDNKRPLHEASANCQTAIVEYLLQYGVDVDSLKRSDWTPLMMACTKPNNLSVIKVLYEHGAKVNLSNKDGWNCFHIVCRQGDLEMVKYLHDLDPSVCKTVSNNGRTPLHTAAMHGRMEIFKFLTTTCELGIDQQDSCGSTPLMDAVKGGHMNLVNLIASKADIGVTDGLGRTVLHVAAECNQTLAIEFLVKRCGVDPNLKTKPVGLHSGGRSALDWAYKEQQFQAIEMLKHLGATESNR